MTRDSVPDSVPVPTPDTAACAEDCPHFMFARCPGCNVEMYAPAVWAFSHGEAMCRCGTTVEPTIHPSRRNKDRKGDY